MSLEEFTGKYERLAEGFGNGAAWARSDGSLGKKYIIERHKRGGKVVSVELMGYRRASAASRSIPEAVRRAHEGGRCVVTGSGSNIEIDHKHGRYEGEASDNPADYQPLTKSVNVAKREHCRTCSEEGKRFDARTLGYSKGWTKGTEDYFTCHGCYWFDPKAFNAAISS